MSDNMREYECVLCNEKFIHDCKKPLKWLGITHDMIGRDIGCLCDKCWKHLNQSKKFERK